MSFLQKILESKKREIEGLYGEKFRFSSALRRSGLSLIAEVKKASPSKGIIRKEFDPVEIAKSFTTAAALSVLTEKEFFLGAPEYIRQIKKEAKQPVLRKDFILDPIQVYESRLIGADAILLIKKILTKSQCQELLNLANQLGLDVLLELHDAEELEDIRGMRNIKIIGVNNRNLETFHTDIQLVHTLQPNIRKYFPEALLVAESGFSKREELKRLEEAGIDAVLIGEGLATHPALLSYFG